ncbi:hypothetical protein NPX13_g3347 [Xylaria arbuscula]|uniref:Uncharacterized protein n=1 Tax=Xylaria arbuscula TaxID=114810 RepID=A0A9W8NHG8_9PEZI|nr:hypothetical protein NPX13_g3347 [Xylaria arbuscula]
MTAKINMSLLEAPNDTLTRAAICHEIFGLENPSQLHGPATDPSALWDYYFKMSALSLHDGGRHIAVRTHRDVVDIACLLKEGATRGYLKEKLRAKLRTPHANEDELLENTIDLVASLVAMCDCGISSHRFSGRTEIQWRDGSLKEFLGKYFDERPILAHEKVKLEQTFKARNFGRITGLEIIWTDNLVDHLRLTDDDTKLTKLAPSESSSGDSSNTGSIVSFNRL